MGLKIEIEPLSDKCKAIAKEELRENEENVKNGIVQLRKLLEGNI